MEGGGGGRASQAVPRSWSHRKNLLERFPSASVAKSFPALFPVSCRGGSGGGRGAAQLPLWPPRFLLLGWTGATSEAPGLSLPGLPSTPHSAQVCGGRWGRGWLTGFSSSFDRLGRGIMSWKASQRRVGEDQESRYSEHT